MVEKVSFLSEKFINVRPSTFQIDFLIAAKLFEYFTSSENKITPFFPLPFVNLRQSQNIFQLKIKWRNEKW